MSTVNGDRIIIPADNELGSNISFDPPFVRGPDDIIGSIPDYTRSESPPLTPIKIYQESTFISNNPQESSLAPPKKSESPAYLPNPQNGKGPIGNYYAEIKWNRGFEQWNLVRFSTPSDNNCLFHAISNSFFEPYHSEMLNGKHVSRHKMVTTLRKELAEKLATKVSDDADAPTHYSILNGGYLAIFAKEAPAPEFELEYMQSQLEAQVSIGYGYMEFIGNALNKDIYILDASHHDIYLSDELALTIKGNRSSIVLYYMSGHYELVGIRNSDGSFDTHFQPQHSFIRFLYDGITQLTQTYNIYGGAKS